MSVDATEPIDGAHAVARSRPGTGPRFSNRARVRSLLIVVVLIPTLAMAVLSIASAQGSWTRRQVSAKVEHDAQRLEALVVTRALLTHEEVNTLVLVIGGELGASPDRLAESYGIDFDHELSLARANVDADPTFQLDPAFADERDDLRMLRSSVEDGTVTSDLAGQTFNELGASIDDLWADQFDALDETVATTSLPGEFGIRLEVLDDAHAAFLAGQRRTSAVVDVLGGRTGPDTTRELLDADARFRTRALELEGGLGPIGDQAWAAFQDDPDASAFERTTEQAIDAAVTGVPDPAWADTTAYGNALFGGVGWSNALVEVVAGAAADVSDMAVQQQAGAVRDFQVGIGFAVLLAALSLLAANVVARSVARPLKELAANARSIRAGRLEVEPVHPRGPKELADTAAAFNEMVVALTAVEARAVAMADDHEDLQASTPIPGRTGEALDRAFDLLRESIRSAEASRGALHELATHDGMTGLLNRTAALDALRHELERVKRHGGSVFVLFVDVDGLKAVNDDHGHDVGDELIMLMAETLRSTTRASDLVARLGGDEFLVAGVLDAGVPSADVETGLGTLVRHLASTIDQATMQVGDLRVPLRASIGVAVSEPGEVSPDAIVHRADSAMYRAKQDATTSLAWSGVDPPDRVPRRDRFAVAPRRTPSADASGSDQTTASRRSAIVSACSSRPPNSGSRA